MATYLDFEKPIEELDNQLIKAAEIAETSDADVSKTVKDLEKKIVAKRKEIADSLTPWQKVQLSRHPA